MKLIRSVRLFPNNPMKRCHYDYLQLAATGERLFVSPVSVGPVGAHLLPLSVLSILKALMC